LRYNRFQTGESMGEFPNKETQFSPGESGNPNGRPKGKSFKAVLEALLDMEASIKDMEDEEIKKIFSDTKNPPTNREIIMAKMTLRAKLDPDSKSAERIMNRVDGLPVQTINQNVVNLPLIIDDTAPAKPDDTVNPEATGSEPATSK